MSAAAVNASSASTAFPPRWLACPSSRKDLLPLLGAVDPQRERGAQPRRRLVEGERRGGRPGGAHVVLDGAPGSTEGRRGGEVMREVRERSPRASLGALEGLPHAQV